MLANANAWTALIIATHCVVVGALSWTTYRHAPGRARILGAAALIPWFAATVWITSSGLVADMTGVLSPLGVVMTIVVGGGLALLLLHPTFAAVIAALPLRWLMAIQVYRVLGVVFLFGWLSGDLPFALGPITAFNDVLVGLTAPFAARWATSGRVRLARLWNIYGLLDFAYAVTVGVLAAPHALRLLATTPDTSALGLLPLSLIALWAVPLSIFLHTASLLRLRATASASATTPALSR